MRNSAVIVLRILFIIIEFENIRYVICFFVNIIDTSFMYIIACLIMVQLYSTRHPDLAAKPHVVYGIFAAIILVAVSGVVSGPQLYYCRSDMNNLRRFPCSLVCRASDVFIILLCCHNTFCSLYPRVVTMDQ